MLDFGARRTPTDGTILTVVSFRTRSWNAATSFSNLAYRVVVIDEGATMLADARVSPDVGLHLTTAAAHSPCRDPKRGHQIVCVSDRHATSLTI